MALHRTRLRYAKRKYRRFWNCFELSATDKHNRQFRFWISKPVTWMWNQHHKGISLSFCERSVHIDVPAFLLPKCRLQLNDWLDGIWFCDNLFFRRVSETTPLEMGQEQKNDIQTDRRKTTDRMRQKECRIPQQAGKLYWQFPPQPALRADCSLGTP